MESLRVLRRGHTVEKKRVERVVREAVVAARNMVVVMRMAWLCCLFDEVERDMRLN